MESSVNLCYYEWRQMLVRKFELFRSVPAAQDTVIDFTPFDWLAICCTSSTYCGAVSYVRAMAVISVARAFFRWYCAKATEVVVVPGVMIAPVIGESMPILGGVATPVLLGLRVIRNTCPICNAGFKERDRKLKGSSDHTILGPNLIDLRCELIVISTASLKLWRIGCLGILGRKKWQPREN